MSVKDARFPHKFLWISLERHGCASKASSCLGSACSYFLELFVCCMNADGHLYRHANVLLVYSQHALNSTLRATNVLHACSECVEIVISHVGAGPDIWGKA